MFWCLQSDFVAIGGFDEDLVCLEDIDFGRRLKRHGRSLGKRCGTIRRAHVVTSCRKCDQFGDWYFVKHPGVVYRLFRRGSRQADLFYYDARSKNAPPKAPKINGNQSKRSIVTTDRKETYGWKNFLP